ncbi:hypothetical protein NN561_009540 [Cricetulus griseus]
MKDVTSVVDDLLLHSEFEASLYKVFATCQLLAEGERASKALSNQLSKVGRDLSRLRPGVGGLEKERRWRSEACPGQPASGPRAGLAREARCFCWT